jgi:hypothetical protein
MKTSTATPSNNNPQIMKTPTLKKKSSRTFRPLKIAQSMTYCGASSSPLNPTHTLQVSKNTAVMLLSPTGTRA